MNGGINTQIPFAKDEWVIDVHNPGQRGQFTGIHTMAGPHLMLQLRYPDGSLKSRPIRSLVAAPVAGASSIEDRLRSGPFGKVRDFQRLITFEKLKGALHEIIYSMEAAQIDFYPYQFKPVLKFINSPTDRLIIADEVGLGKTIESALIWVELQARRHAKRLIVLCTPTLMEKWRDELRSKFLLDAKIVDFNELQEHVTELKDTGPEYDFVLISSYPALRSPRRELKFLDRSPEDLGETHAKTRFQLDLRNWDQPYPPFDLVVFDEAHYMRSAGSSTFHLGESLSAHNDTAILCVSATPVNNSNTDLHSLLRLIDRDMFETQGMFDLLLKTNRPSIMAMSALSRTPLDADELKDAIEGMEKSSFINNSPLFYRFRELVSEIELTPRDNALLARAQDVAEKLNLLGSYINRTRRVQVEEGRPERRARVLTVEYTREEMKLYKAILHLVRRKCRNNRTPFHVFRVLGLQLRAASCLPVIAQLIRDGGLGPLPTDAEDLPQLLTEAIGYSDFDSSENDSQTNEIFDTSYFKELVDYDFEANDSKFWQLVELLDGSADRKVIVFAFYRETLAYLKRRLEGRGVSVAMIRGGGDVDQRWVELDRFKDELGPRVLLSSEVGSEGIDLQFCSTVVNYDLPWNPMRVEQRIGRIDRVGQKAKVLSIVNFKVRDTVEERLYERLHKKLLLFASSLGDLEAIIGEQIQALTVDLLSQELTPEEEVVRIERTERVIENKLVEIRRLEESGDSLVALSDYVQKKIREDRERGRYVQPEELEEYLSDFFEREFLGTEITYGTPAIGCIRLRLSLEAHSSLTRFVESDRSLSARPLRMREFSITFRREVFERLSNAERRLVQFVNHLSPLIRWITKRNRDGIHSFYNVSALLLEDAALRPGDYCYRIERWKFQGLAPRELMAFSVKQQSEKEPLNAVEAESIVQRLLRFGKDWDYPDFDGDALKKFYDQLRIDLEGRFAAELAGYEADNGTAIQIRVQRAANHWDRLIGQSEKAIETMKITGRDESLIRGRETRLRNEKENKERKLSELRRGIEIDFETEPLAAGIFRVVPAV